jgi:ubiquinone/menaquinone biosynthesis C-methylase UbiE
MRLRPSRLRFVYTAAVTTCIFGIAFPGCRFWQEESEAARFDRFAREAFKEVYPSLAEQILGDYNVREGTCADIGCGPAYLSIEVAKRSNLKIIGVDIDPEAVRIARKNVEREGLTGRIGIEQGDVHELRFQDGAIDLVISRGSFPFWNNTAQAFREIYRVLKPGGVAFVGGGMGRAITPEKKAAIKQKVEKAGFMNRCKNIITPVMMQETLESIDIRDYKIFGDGPGDSGCRCGMWIEIRKPQKSRTESSTNTI